MNKKKAETPQRFGRDQIRAKILRPAIPVLVPEWGATVLIKVPSLATLTEMKLKYPTNEEYTPAFVLAFCPDLTPADVVELQGGDGIQFAFLVNAINKAGILVSDVGVGNS